MKNILNVSQITLKTSYLLFAVLIIGLSTQSCSNRKKNASDFKPMKPSGSQYSAYDATGAWALEMELNGDFHFIDFMNDFEINSKTPEYVGKRDGYKQSLEWIMLSGKENEYKVKFTILQENCYNFGYVNNPFYLEVVFEDKVIFRLGECGTFHNDLGLNGKYTLNKVNNQEVLFRYKLEKAPILDLKKTKNSNMIHGRFACRYYQGDLKLLDNTLTVNYNIHPTPDCTEDPGLTELSELFGNKKYNYQLSTDDKKRTLLTLSDKNNTFVFVKNE